MAGKMPANVMKNIITRNMDTFLYKVVLSYGFAYYLKQ